MICDMIPVLFFQVVPDAFPYLLDRVSSDRLKENTFSKIQWIFKLFLHVSKSQYFSPIWVLRKQKEKKKVFSFKVYIKVEYYFLKVGFKYLILCMYCTRAIITRSWILTIHKARISRKKPLEKTFLDIKKWVKSIQTAGYNGARTVYQVDFGHAIIHTA